MLPAALLLLSYMSHPFKPLLQGLTNLRYLVGGEQALPVALLLLSYIPTHPQKCTSGLGQYLVGGAQALPVALLRALQGVGPQVPHQLRRAAAKALPGTRGVC